MCLKRLQLQARHPSWNEQKKFRTSGTNTVIIITHSFLFLKWLNKKNRLGEKKKKRTSNLNPDLKIPNVFKSFLSTWQFMFGTKVRSESRRWERHRQKLVKSLWIFLWSTEPPMQRPTGIHPSIPNGCFSVCRERQHFRGISLQFPQVQHHHRGIPGSAANCQAPCLWWGCWTSGPSSAFPRVYRQTSSSHRVDVGRDAGRVSDVEVTVWYLEGKRFTKLSFIKHMAII